MSLDDIAKKHFFELHISLVFSTTGFVLTAINMRKRSSQNGAGEVISEKSFPITIHLAIKVSKMVTR